MSFDLSKNNIKDNNKKLSGLYTEISDKIINELRITKINPNDVALDVGVSSEKMLDLLFNSDNGDYLAYREIDASIKKLTKSRSER